MSVMKALLGFVKVSVVISLVFAVWTLYFRVEALESQLSCRVFSETKEIEQVGKGYNLIRVQPIYKCGDGSIIIGHPDIKPLK